MGTLSASLVPSKGCLARRTTAHNEHAAGHCPMGSGSRGASPRSARASKSARPAALQPRCAHTTHGAQIAIVAVVVNIYKLRKLHRLKMMRVAHTWARPLSATPGPSGIR